MGNGLEASVREVQSLAACSESGGTWSREELGIVGGRSS